MKLISTGLAFLCLLGCARKNIQTKEAVRDAVVEYLTARQDKTGIVMSAMNVDVTTMSFQQDRANVTVAFNLKTGEGGMQMGYELERQGDKWVVKGTAGTGGHEAPPQALPPDHPPTGGMPAGHPPVGAK